MDEKKFSYYQFRKDLGYQVYLRFEDFDFENLFTETLELLGFDKISRDTIKKNPFDLRKTKVLKIVKASPRVSRQIDRNDYSSNKSLGPESLSVLDGYSVYKFQNIAMMLCSHGNALWELGVKSNVDQEGLRTVLIRYLSFALEGEGVLGFWGVPIEEGFVVMNQKSANSEAIFIDVKKEKIITFDGVKNMESDLQIIRLDDTLRSEMKRMKKDELYSYLLTHMTNLGFDFFAEETKYFLRELSSMALGYIYPESQFKPRMHTAA